VPLQLSIRCPGGWGKAERGFASAGIGVDFAADAESAGALSAMLIIKAAVYAAFGGGEHAGDIGVVATAGDSFAVTRFPAHGSW